MEFSSELGNGEAETQELHLGQGVQGPTLEQLEPIIHQWGWAIDAGAIDDAVARRLL